MSQQDLAARIGVTQQQVSSWENGSRRIADRHRAALAGAIGVDLSELLRWIIEDEETRRDAVTRELAVTVEGAERTVSLLDRILALLEGLDERQAEILRLLREPGRDGGRRRA